MNRKNKTVTLTIVAAMAALSTVIYMIFPEIPLVPGVEHLKMDFSDVPAILTGFLLGPMPGILVEVIKNLIHLTRTTTVGIGELINVGVGAIMIAALCGFSRLFARILKRKNTAAPVYFVSCALTILCTVVAGWLLNGILTPVYFGIAGIPITSASVLAGVWGSTLLNAVKAALNLLPFYPVYLALFHAFTKIGD